MLQLELTKLAADLLDFHVVIVHITLGVVVSGSNFIVPSSIIVVVVGIVAVCSIIIVVDYSVAAALAPLCVIVRTKVRCIGFTVITGIIIDVLNTSRPIRTLVAVASVVVCRSWQLAHISHVVLRIVIMA